MKKRSIQLPFCGFYESEGSAMIDDEINQVFGYSDGGGEYNVPDETWYKKECAIDYKAIEIELVKAYVDAFAAQYEDETGIALNPEFEDMVSPREYNFSTDRVFVSVPYGVVEKLFAESVKDGHAQLAGKTKESCTSYDGFMSFYSNDLAAWLEKPLADWDHNELEILLLAVLDIHYTPSKHGSGHFDVYELLENWCGNGGLSEAVWGAIPEKVREFADMQRDYGAAMDFALWVETGKAYKDGTDLGHIEDGDLLPEPHCDKTIDMKL